MDAWMGEPMECITLSLLPTKEKLKSQMPSVSKKKWTLDTIGENMVPKSECAYLPGRPPCRLSREQVHHHIPVKHPAPSLFLSPPHTDLHGSGSQSVSHPCNSPPATRQFASPAISTANSASECQAGTWSNCRSRFLLTQMLTFCWHNLQ